MRSTSIPDLRPSYTLGSEHDDRWLLWLIGTVVAGVALSLAFLGYASDRASGPEPPAIDEAVSAPAEPMPSLGTSPEPERRTDTAGDEPVAALATADATLARDPDNAAALLARGRSLHALGRHGEAERALLRSIDVDPANAEARNLLGLVYLETGRYAEALAAFREAASLAPDDARIRANIDRASVGPEAP